MKKIAATLLAAAFLLQASLASAEGWQPPAEAKQIPLWPDKAPLARPEVATLESDVEVAIAIPLGCVIFGKGRQRFNPFLS